MRSIIFQGALRLHVVCELILQIPRKRKENMNSIQRFCLRIGARRLGFFGVAVILAAAFCPVNSFVMAAFVLGFIGIGAAANTADLEGEIQALSQMAETEFLERLDRANPRQQTRLVTLRSYSG